MSTCQRVYGDTGVYLGMIWADELIGFQAENRTVRTRWFREEVTARAWLASQVIRD